jgi:hypothetical protein
MAKTQNQKISETYDKIRSSFNDQYIISSYLPKVMENVKSDNRFKNTSKIIPISDKVDPFVFANFLNTNGKNAKLRSIFNTFNNAQLSILVPEIRIIVRRRTGPNKYVTKVIPIQNLQPEMPFGKSPDVSGATIGLKAIDFDLAGTSPETATNDINASATFFGNTLAVFQEHPEYVDLINPHFASKDGTGSEMLFQVGWAMPSGPTIKSLNFTADQKAALKSQFQTYVMNYTSHNFSFNENGSFILQVEYVSYIDGVMRDANFLGDKEILNEVYPKLKKPEKKLEPNVHESIMNYIKENHEGATSDYKKRVYNALAHGNVADNISKYKLRIDELAVQHFEQMFEEIPYLTYELPIRQMNAKFLQRAMRRVLGSPTNKSNTLPGFYGKNGPTDNLEERLKRFLLTDELFSQEAVAESAYMAATAVEVAATLSKSLPLKTTSVVPTSKELMETKFIDVTTLGKILENFIKKSTGVKDLMVEKDVTLILGTIKISNPENKAHDKVYSLYDLPIALSTLKEAVRKLYTSKLKTKVSLRAFIATILKEARKYYMQGDLILDAGKILSANSLRSTQITCSPTSRDRLRNAPNVATLKLGIRSDLRSLNPEKLANLYCIVAGPADDAPEASLDNYVVGAAGSIVKKVNFSQVNSATMAARQDDNIVAALRSNNLGVIPQLYNVKMDVVGNLNFLPGYLFNLMPTILGVSTAIKDSIIKDLGLMGTFMTLKVHHTFSQDGFTTSLEAYNISTQKYINKTIASAKKGVAK